MLKRKENVESWRAQVLRDAHIQSDRKVISSPEDLSREFLSREYFHREVFFRRGYRMNCGANIFLIRGFRKKIFFFMWSAIQKFPRLIRIFNVLGSTLKKPDNYSSQKLPEISGKLELLRCTIASGFAASSTLLQTNSLGLLSRTQCWFSI